MTTPKCTETFQNALTVLTALNLQSQPDPDSLKDLIQLGSAAALATNTTKTYDSGWKSWSQWACERGVADLPATPGDLQAWLVALVGERKKPTTLRTYLASVAKRHASLPGPNPAHDLQVRQLLTGLNRLLVADGITPQQAGPLRWKHIQRIIATAQIARPNQPGGRVETPEQAQRRGAVDIAMITLAHDAALRSSELLALTWGDIETSPNGDCVIRIRRSKTDQTGHGAFAPVCQFTAQAVAAIKPQNADSSERVFDLSPNTISRRMKAAAEAAGLDPTNISSHSPRIGMAQDLAANGVSIAGLMQAGRWKAASSAVRYTEHLTAHDTPVGQYLKAQQVPRSSIEHGAAD